MSLTLVTAPGAEPIALAEAKEHCRVDTTHEDALLGSYITAARDYVENVTGRQLVTATWDLTLDTFPCWPGRIDVPKAPLASVTSISYVDTDGATQTVSSATYIVSKPAGAAAERGRITLAYSQVWPPTRCQADAVTVRFVAGYGNADAVPQAIKTAMLQLIAHWYSQREAVTDVGTTVPLMVDALLGPYRTWAISTESATHMRPFAVPYTGRVC